MAKLFTYLSLSLLLVSCASVQDSFQRKVVDSFTMRFARKIPQQRLEKILAKAKRLKLVEIRKIVPNIQVDLKYASLDNIAKKQIYFSNMPALMREESAAKILKAQEYLRPYGLGLIVYDAYRPPSAHARLLDATGNNPYVQSPAYGWSLHCYGAAFDCGLINLKNGEKLKMPSEHDHFGREAWSIYRGNDPVVRANNLLLKKAMVRNGFKPIIHEWWHFYDDEINQEHPVYASEIDLPLPKR